MSMGWLPKLPTSKLKWVQSSRGSALSKKTVDSGDWAYLSDFASSGYSRLTSARESAVKELSLCLQDVSVVLPVYNEQDCIQRTFEAVLEHAESHPSYTFLFVNDGSSDRTEQILRQQVAQAKTEQIQLVSYRDRGGKGYAIRRGVAAATGDFVCFTDGDLAYSLDHLDQLTAQLVHFDVVIGCRNMVPGGTRGPHLTRKIAGAVFNGLSRGLMSLPYTDMQAGLKGFRRGAAQELFRRQVLLGFSFDVELIYLARKLGYAIGEIPAQVSLDHGRKLSKVNLVLDSLKMLVDLLKIRLNDLLGRYE
jgi:dolichyl-phosphate beta-glucosyltransferase